MKLLFLGDWQDPDQPVFLFSDNSLIDLSAWLTGNHIGLIYNVDCIGLGTPCNIVEDSHSSQVLVVDSQLGNGP